MLAGGRVKLAWSVYIYISIRLNVMYAELEQNRGGFVWLHQGLLASTNPQPTDLHSVFHLLLPVQHRHRLSRVSPTSPPMPRRPPVAARRGGQDAFGSRTRRPLVRPSVRLFAGGASPYWVVFQYFGVFVFLCFGFWLFLVYYIHDTS